MFGRKPKDPKIFIDQKIYYVLKAALWRENLVQLIDENKLGINKNSLADLCSGFRSVPDTDATAKNQKKYPYAFAKTQFHQEKRSKNMIREFIQNDDYIKTEYIHPIKICYHLQLYERDERNLLLQNRMLDKKYFPNTESNNLKPGEIRVSDALAKKEFIKRDPETNKWILAERAFRNGKVKRYLTKNKILYV